MNEIASSASQRLLEYGLAGIVILALSAAIVYLARRYDRLQDQRYAELKEWSENLQAVLDRNTEALVKHAQAFDYLSDHCSLVSPRRRSP